VNREERFRGGVRRTTGAIRPLANWPLGRLRVTREVLEIGCILPIVPFVHVERENVVSVQITRRGATAQVLPVLTNGPAATYFVVLSRDVQRVAFALREFGWPVSE
jgi:hypothetical protein